MLTPSRPIMSVQYASDVDVGSLVGLHIREQRLNAALKELAILTSSKGNFH